MQTVCSVNLEMTALLAVRKPQQLVSEVTVMTDVKNKRVIFATDGSMNIDPSPDELCSIALNAAEAVKEFGLIPKVAMLSFSTKGSGGKHDFIEKVVHATDLVKERDPQLLVDGELQVDAAVNPWAAERKCPNSPLKGDANVLVFPDLDASNVFFHGLGQFSDMTLDFTIMKGLEKPVAILGRSTPKETHYKMLLSLAMQVNAASEKKD